LHPISGKNVCGIWIKARFFQSLYFVFQSMFRYAIKVSLSNQGLFAMIIRIFAVSHLREKYWQDAAADHARRLRPYARLELVEIPEARIPASASPAEEAKAMDQEGRAILERLEKHSGPVVVLDRLGKAPDWQTGWKDRPCKARETSHG
jgi:hypothetical protein